MACSSSDSGVPCASTLSFPASHVTLNWGPGARKPLLTAGGSGVEAEAGGFWPGPLCKANPKPEPTQPERRHIQHLAEALLVISRIILAWEEFIEPRIGAAAWPEASATRRQHGGYHMRVTLP